MRHWRCVLLLTFLAAAGCGDSKKAETPKEFAPPPTGKMAPFGAPPPATAPGKS